MHTDPLIRPWFDRLREDLPDLELFDAHTHTGANDPDGFAATADELLAMLAPAGARAVVFPLQEPTGYPAANDRVLGEAAASGGRLVAFCRVDPAAEAAAEAERCLDRGARGIKLHPRAEGFQLSHPALRDVFALAEGRRVPIICHAGRGIPALGRDALELVSEFPGARLILAHAGICDLSWLWREAGAHPNLFFDTAWWNADDLLALFALVPPGQVLFASDAPYSTPMTAAVWALRCALQVGLTHEQVRAVAGGQLARLVAGEDPLDLGPAPGAAGADSDLLLARVHSWLIAAMPALFEGGGSDEAISLARLSCEVGEDAPQAAVCRSVLALLDRQAEEVARAPGFPGGDGVLFTPGAHLVVAASIVARTPRVALPELADDVAVGERSS